MHGVVKKAVHCSGRQVLCCKEDSVQFVQRSNSVLEIALVVAVGTVAGFYETVWAPYKRKYRFEPEFVQASRANPDILAELQDGRSLIAVERREL